MGREPGLTTGPWLPGPRGFPGERASSHAAGPPRPDLDNEKTGQTRRLSASRTVRDAERDYELLCGLASARQHRGSRHAITMAAVNQVPSRARMRSPGA
ncbi:hypothetical protein GCM10009663_65920 [Kitasatospora arboriphila]|uniref:Uncharacterized protein n=1 Tax=Kitasatospora arboriphila TaxID=258052 RepID=A0ABN1U687_9ACTN